MYNDIIFEIKDEDISVVKDFICNYKDFCDNFNLKPIGSNAKLIYTDDFIFKYKKLNHLDETGEIYLNKLLDTVFMFNMHIDYMEGDEIEAIIDRYNRVAMYVASSYLLFCRTVGFTGGSFQSYTEFHKYNCKAIKYYTNKSRD